MLVDEFRVRIFLIVVNLSFYKTTPKLSDVSIVVSCWSMYFKICVVGQQFSMSTQFNCQKTFLFQAIQFSQTILFQIIQFSISIVFVPTQLNVKTVLFQEIPFSISTQFSSIWSIDGTLIRWYRARVDQEWWQWRGTPHSPKLHHYWNITIRLFNVISRTLVGTIYQPLRSGRIWHKVNF